MDLELAARIHRDYLSREVVKTVAANDQMWQSGPDWYFSVGESAVDIILRGLSLSWQQNPTRILDLPCGHGRVARQLRRAFPEAQLFVSDLDSSGVEFCQTTFNASPIFSKTELTEVSLPENLDIIWIGSLFTHLDEHRTTRWLNYLAHHLASHGVMIATFHGLWSIEEQRRGPMINDAAWQRILSEYHATGFGYERYSEFDLGDYGVSLSSAAKILSIATAIEGTRVLAYTERGWANNHDVLIITRNDRLAHFG
jgi:SAM-dependent methyltransferase